MIQVHICVILVSITFVELESVVHLSNAELELELLLHELVLVVMTGALFCKILHVLSKSQAQELFEEVLITSEQSDTITINHYASRPLFQALVAVIFLDV